MTPIVAETTEAAFAIEAALDEYIDLEMGTAELSVARQADLSRLDSDQQIPPELLVDPDVAEMDALGGSRYRNFYNMAVRQKLTLRRIIALNDRAMGHDSATGAVVDVADHMQEWFEGRACDGFAITPVTVPEGVDAVCEILVTELRRRGLARREYDGTTLRENRGLRRPASPRRAEGPATV
ncbi:hypothetical protein [Mycolicibacterium goodii]|uniref:hypothetical protein n=1 Tax=Mycolicibacterium goodii TaxID=134601 RepID=UPI000673A5B8